MEVTPQPAQTIAPKPRIHILGIPFYFPGFSHKQAMFECMFPDAITHGPPHSDWQGEITWDGSDPRWKDANWTALASLAKSVQPGDVVLNMVGSPQRSITDIIASKSLFPPNLCLEAGIGYRGSYHEHRVWESYAWMHHEQADPGDCWFDQVIYPCVDPADFPPQSKSDYCLYIGRINVDKGVLVAQDICEAAGVKLVFAGKGDINLIRKQHKHIGNVTGAEKAELIGAAQCVIMPTIYLEPGGRVAIEAQIAGAALLTTDWGCLTETCTTEVGRRFRSLAQGVQGLKECMDLDPTVIRAHAASRFSPEVIKPQWEGYFERLRTKFEKGWYQL